MFPLTHSALVLLSWIWKLVLKPATLQALAWHLKNHSWEAKSPVRFKYCGWKRLNSKCYRVHWENNACCSIRISEMLVYMFVGFLFCFFFTTEANVLRYSVWGIHPSCPKVAVSLVRRCLISAAMVSPVCGVNLHHREPTWCSHMPGSMASNLYEKSVTFENCSLTLSPGPAHSFLCQAYWLHVCSHTQISTIKYWYTYLEVLILW